MKYLRLYTIIFFSICFNNLVKSQTVNPFGNALIPDLVADASICYFDSTFYCYITTDGYDDGLNTSGPPVVWKSKDFVNWSFSGYYFPSAVGKLYWAPSNVVKVDSKYFIYPTVNKFMYPAVADSPEGPFKLAIGEDKFIKPYSSATLLKSNDPKGPQGIDAEIFIDDDGQAYVYWQQRKAALLNSDMKSIDTNSLVTIQTPRTQYSEGPIFFKRNGIYYYLYTQGGDEKYQYAYGMSKISPLGPFDFPENDLVSTTNYEKNIFGPGHGCVFNVPNTDDYYFTFLEFGRRSTNRQIYTNKMEFNEDGTIKPVELTLGGVGSLNNIPQYEVINVISCNASSFRSELKIEPMKDTLFKRIEYFVPEFAFDKANGSRWMASDEDYESWIVADLGKQKKVQMSEVYFVRPTAGHAYVLEFSDDGENWKVCGGHHEIKVQSPHTDSIIINARYLRIKITKGIQGIWEWNLY